jgi:hypothetical protein
VSLQDSAAKIEKETVTIECATYARDQGRLVTFKAFGSGDSTAAETARLELELDLNRRGIEHEVVLLEADNEEALRRTHRRYFESLSELVDAF